jgi:hypothetical protein
MEALEITCKIISFTGKTLSLTIDSQKSFSDLRNLITDDLDISDFVLIYNGRVIKDESESISKHTQDNKTPTFYLNASKVHGGCYSIDNKC